MADAPITHGGNLHEAALRYGIPRDAWLDLSTGINPHGFPVPPVPADAWRRLPEDDGVLAAHAARYYRAPGAAHVLPVAGSQAAIRALPALFARGTVGVAPLAYSEYAPAFARHGHSGAPLDCGADTLPAALTYAIVANPNNPTAERVDRTRLLRWHAQLVARGGALIVDEAFSDAESDAHASLAADTHRDGLVVLRSVGKFFGLAGVRAGFALAAPALLARLRDALGAWTVSGPARHAVLAAFADAAWQHAMRERLAHDGARLAALLRAHGFVTHATPLFSWSADPRAHALHDALAARGIWTRYFAHAPSVRIGLPAGDDDWRRLERTLAECVPTLAAAAAHPSESTTRD
ncbi:threonine-phosphate decarboxylase CobD [Burkholderia pseudomallei]|uniref:threonine-phosphate decarboxylase CobD n=1 Tax=Burkholderia pseudomallei TaxID=28450 RepID=UPI0003D8C508|nr:threonine-phosphate decarboxylase CobD [Burkholderia pseudomallei]AHE34332.1 threonine-phosphate decarboxylase [Burkholderia pseudomallei NAU20B-16]AHG33917.1 threonine-phosphate decarboxylase [Burkholderia pseudomallei MSHR511]AHG66404.1 threonine-phosphate decarboxylase [Burkholderia pseudomallei MSHR146]KGV71992.1 threonine-phosphate decarboxylase [Burkholderia pseudomallei MSHR3964]KGV88353.1 threonine-phosphate decarboxylase [Burkholderia pseudomallei MSHR3951]